MIRPQGCRFLNYEGEVAIVIGRTTRNIRLAEAPTYIGGYMLANDYALHDFRDADRGAMIRVKGCAIRLGLVGPRPGTHCWSLRAAQILRTYVRRAGRAGNPVSRA